MPTVPTYDSFQATPSSVPQAQIGAQAQAPQFQNNAAAQAKQTGQAMQQFGGEAGKIALEMANQANTSLVTDAGSQLAEFEMNAELGASGYTKLRGKDALDLPDNKSLADHYGEQYDKFTAKVLKDGLKNDAQREAFQKIIARRKAAFTGRVMQHANHQQQVYGISVQEGAIKVSAQQAAANWGKPERVAESIQTIKAATYDRGKLLGHSAKEIEADTQTALSAVHSSVVMQAIDAGKVDYAAAYLKANDKQLTETARHSLKGLLEVGSIKQNSQQEADRIFAMPISDEERMIEARNTTDPKLREALVPKVKARINEERTLRRQAEEDRANQAYSMIAKGEDVPESILSATSGKVQVALRKLQAEGGKVPRDNLAAYAALKAVPADRLTVAGVMKFAPMLTTSTMKHFIDLATNPSAQEKSVISNATRISNTIATLGLNDEEKGVLYKQVEAWQQQLGHNPTHKELGDYLDFMQKEVLTDKGRLYDSHAVVANIRVDGVPDAQIPGIAHALINAGKPASDENILSVYRKAVNSGKL